MRNAFGGKLAAFAMSVAATAASASASAMYIVVGQVGPMSGLDATQGRAYATGVELVFKQVNQSGGVNGHHFVLVRKDDGGRPGNTVSFMEALIAESNPLVLTGAFGNRNVAELIASGLLPKQKIALVGYRSWNVYGNTPYVYNVRAGVREELVRITEHLATIGISRLGLLYEDGPEAARLVAAAEEAVGMAHCTLVAKASYPAGTTKVASSVETFVRGEPQAILVVATGAAAAGFIEAYRAAGGRAQIFTHSGADVEQMAKRLSDEQLQGVAIAQVTPNPYKISSRVAKELNDLVAKAGTTDVPVSYAMIEGFIAAKVIVEAVRRQGKTPTREGLVAALDSMDNFDVGGYVVGYRSGAHAGSRFVELSILSSAGRVRQ